MSSGKRQPFCLSLNVLKEPISITPRNDVKPSADAVMITQVRHDLSNLLNVVNEDFK